MPYIWSDVVEGEEEVVKETKRGTLNELVRKLTSDRNYGT